MAKEQQLTLLEQGVDTWNQWRETQPSANLDLSSAVLSQANLGGINFRGAILRGCDFSEANLLGADLRSSDLQGSNLQGAYLSQANFSEANLTEVNFSSSYLFEADLSRVNLTDANLQWVYLGRADLSGSYLIGADLRDVDLRGACLVGANLSQADLRGANLIGADLQGADLSGADLSGADLSGARLLKTNFMDANLAGCSIYGISSWGLNLEGANQSSLSITPLGEPIVTVDYLEVAQLIYLLLNNQIIHQVVDQITAQVALIVGNFATPERQDFLEVLREALRNQNYVPIALDCHTDVSKDLKIEVLFTLAGISQLIIADATDAQHLLKELQQIVPKLPSIPVQPLVQVSSEKKSDLLNEIQSYSWVLEPYHYNTLDDALAALDSKIITPAYLKAREIRDRG
jgi:uncharacterized protein YjbI with pentapeptide repeats